METPRIGVSNFQAEDLRNILGNCSVVPAVNQVLAHVGNVPFELTHFCADNGIQVEAYSPIAHGEAGRIEGIAALNATGGLPDYGDHSFLPVFGGKL